MSMKSKTASLFKIIGPGLLLAGAAIGVSHVIQATRAGAGYGFALIWVLILGCASKYPFMEFGPRYLAATGDDLITGYKKYGKSAYLTYLGVTLGTMFIIQAAIVLVTAGVAEYLFQLGWSPFVWSVVLLGTTALLLTIGQYAALDKTMKIIIVTLTLATLIATGLAFSPTNTERVLSTAVPSYWTVSGFFFLIAFMGWMPIPVDAAGWHSLWMKENAELTQTKITLRSARTDFNTGYLSASIIGLFFLLLGALMMFGTGEQFSTNGVEFSAQVIDLYQSSLGNWSGIIMAVAVFVTLLSTLITVVDAYPRVMQQYLKNASPQRDLAKFKSIYVIALWVIPLISLIILNALGKNFIVLVDFAASLSFLGTAILAYFNYRLVTQKSFPEEAKPSRAYRIYSLLCLAVLVSMALGYLYLSFFT